MTEVKYVVTEAYEWTVPALIDFGKDAGVNEKREVNTTLDKDAKKLNKQVIPQINIAYK